MPSTSSSSSSSVCLATTVGLVMGYSLASRLDKLLARFVFKRRSFETISCCSPTNLPFSTATERFFSGPPFPPELLSILYRCSLCQLCTCVASAPHVSTMIFTYFEEDRVLIMSSRLDTQKVKNLQQNPRVAVLCHDFPVNAEEFDGTTDFSTSLLEKKSTTRSESRTASATIYGAIRILDPKSGKNARRLQQVHLEKHPNYKQFIEGEGLGVLVLDILNVRMCDIRDKVTSWDRESSS